MTFQRPSNSIRPIPTPMPTWLPTGFQALPTSCQPCASNPPYPPALETPNAAGVAARRSRRLEGERPKRARLPHVRSNSETGAICRVLHNPFEHAVTVTFAHTAPTHVRRSGDQAGIAVASEIDSVIENHGRGFLRALSHELQHSRRPTRARDAGETAELGERLELPGQKDPGGGWWQGKRALGGYFEVPPLFRGPSPKSRFTPSIIVFGAKQ